MMSMIAKNRIKSTWTPLSNEETNSKIFQERRALVGRWFDKWNGEQRRKVLSDLIDKAKVRQLEYIRDLVQEKCPTIHKDLTRFLPRVLSLYIFSFLDPRSLCRCAQVCWFWKYLSELDQLWMAKCLRLGWYVAYTPGPYETGLWKRTYIEHIKSLKVLHPRTLLLQLSEPEESTHLELERLNTDRSRKPPKSKGKKSPAPWRGSDPKPTDTWRYNILENDDIVESVVKVREKPGYYSSAVKKVTHNAQSKVKSGSNVLTAAKRSNSAPRLLNTAPAGLSLLDERPHWGSNVQHHNAVVTFAPKPVQNGMHAHTPISPPPTNPASKPATARSARDPPSSPLFPRQPWNVPDPDDEDDD